MPGRRGATAPIVHCRLGHDTKHFNVGQYRRVQKSASEVQDASFFDPNNEVSPLCHPMAPALGG